MVRRLQVAVGGMDEHVVCKGYNSIPDTPRGESHKLCVGEGDKRMLCDFTGTWVEQDGSCCRAFSLPLT